MVRNLLKNRWYYHILIWFLATLIVFVFMASDSLEMNTKTIDTITIIVPSVMLTYILFFFQDYFFPKKKYTAFGFLTISISIAMGYFAAYFSVHLYGKGAETNLNQWIQNMLIMAFIVMVSRIAKQGIVNQFEVKKLQLEKLKMEIHILKGQLNPHFLFNTINNICGVNQVDSEKSTEMLINLAELLRYHLEFSEQQKIPIHKEILLIEAYIELEKMRLRGNCSITFDWPKTNTEILIAPLLLLPFIENAFKHGTHTSLLSFINIKLNWNESELELIVENSLFKNQKIIKNNIGQKNILKRLQLIYPEKHKLIISENDKTYLTCLSIKL